MVDTACFKLIDTKRNPADIVSCGVKTAELLSNRLWFSGPELLTLDKDSWPSLKVGKKFILLSEIESRGTGMCMCDVICEEVEKNRDSDVCMYDVINKENGNDCMCAVAINNEANIENNLQLQSSSSLFKLFRVTALVYRFVEKLKRKAKIKIKEVENKTEKNVPDINLGIINTEDVRAASNLWLRHIQRAFHSKKYDDLKKNLNVFIDEHGLFRCRGRFANSSLPYEKKYPILLPTDSRLTILVIRDAHKSVLHNGVRETINEIRCKYWIPRIRQKVKNIINRCVTCKKFEGHPYFYPESPALPECRIVPSHCFSNIGIDYAGPVFIKTGSQLKLNGGCAKFGLF